MKIKKVLAFAAALSVLSVTGVNVFAEEKSVAEINAGIITLGTTTLVGESKDFTCDGYNFVAELSANPGGMVVDKFITIYKYEEDGSKRETNINGKLVCTFRNGENPGLEENATLYYILSINGDSITINSTFFPWEYDEAQYESVNYVYDKATNSFVEPGSITTTTTTTFDINNYIGTYNAPLNGYIYEMKIWLDSDELFFNVKRDANFPGGWGMSSSEYNASTVSYYNGMARGFTLDEFGNVLPGNGATAYLNGTGNFVFNSDGSVTWNSDNDDFTPLTFSRAAATTTTTTTTSLMEGIKVDEKVKNFELDGVAFYAQRMYEYKERVSGDLVEYDKYDYVSIFLADGTPTNIQEEFVFVEPGCTGGWAGYSISDYVSVSGNNLVITHKGDSDVSITYTYDKLTNKFVEASTITTTTSKTTTTTTTKTTTTTIKSTSTTDTSDTTGETSGSTTGGTANSPITADKMVIPAIAGSAALVLGAVICISKKRK